MKKAFIFLAEGFEEIEALSTVDILRRGGIDVTMVSITGNSMVTGAHGIPVKADKLFESVESVSGDMLILPGGMPGSNNLNAHQGLKDLIMEYDKDRKWICAICAAPLVLGGLGLLKEKSATCYPGVESQLTGATIKTLPVVQDENIITGRGPGLTFEFALQLVTVLQGAKKAEEVAEGLLLNDCK